MFSLHTYYHIYPQQCWPAGEGPPTSIFLRNLDINIVGAQHHEWSSFYTLETSPRSPRSPWRDSSISLSLRWAHMIIWMTGLLKPQHPLPNPALTRVASESETWKTKFPGHPHDPTKTVTTLRVSPWRRLPMGLSCRLPFKPFSESQVASCG